MSSLTDHHPPVRYYQPAGLSVLFTPLPKGGRRPVLDLSYDLGPEHKLRFSAREALGVPEQTLLLALLGLAGEQYADRGDDAVVSAADERTVAGRLWSGLYPDGGQGAPQTVMVRTTWEALNRRCGTGSGGSTIEMRKAGLRRLCEVVVWEEHAGRRTTRQSFLLVWVEGDGPTELHAVYLERQNRQMAMGCDCPDRYQQLAVVLIAEPVDFFTRQGRTQGPAL